jgi:hypothetical protein
MNLMLLGILQRFRRETRRVAYFLRIEIQQRFPDLPVMIGQLPSAPD